MASRFYRTLALIVLISASVSIAASQEKKLLTDAELLSLVAGNALPENIAHEIQSRGLGFQPSAAYRSLLTDAGANALIFAALGKVKPSDASGNGSNSSAELDTSRDKQAYRLTSEGRRQLELELDRFRELSRAGFARLRLGEA
jgi:hypothetical protein